MLSALYAYDLALYRAINQNLTHPRLDSMVLFLSSNLLWGCALVGAFAFAIGTRRAPLVKTLVALCLAVAVSDAACTYVLKPAFQRVRPCHGIEGARRVNGICGSEMGMPSNHASNGMAAATVLGVFLGGLWFGVASAAVLLVAFTRVYLGVHYPGDTLVGMLTGLVFGGLVAAVALIWISRRTQWIGKSHPRN